MLKAMRYALFRESARTGAPLQAANLSALYEFTSLLADTFPTTTIEGASDNSVSRHFYKGNFKIGKFQTVLHLDRSSRAVRVFSRLRDFIAEKGLEAPISVEDWQKEFLAAEEEAGHPFPLNTNWEHCAGSSTQYRGYTCGLWTTFHALTVSAFKNWQNKTNGNRIYYI